MSTFTAQEISRAREAGPSGAPFLEALQEQSGLDGRAFLERLCATTGAKPIAGEELYALVPAFDVIPFAEAQARECAVFRDASGALTLVHSDPFDVRLRAWAEELAQEPLAARLAHRADLAAWLARHEETLRAMDGMLERASSGAGAAEQAEDISLKRIHEDTSPIVKLVNSTLYDALKLGASDVHLESTGAGLVVRYRLDGVLSQVARIDGAPEAEQVLSRIKVMAQLDIAERRVPQDGRFRVSARGREIDVRVSVIPTIFGEDAVLRVLDKAALADEARGLRLERLGFDDDTLGKLRFLAREPYGMMLVTGPTGSGKTTTLYAAITEINSGYDKIVTIEDPVEYQLPGVPQIPVNEKKGLTFARGLRSILRHDPDKIMVGEIRDPETAQIAVQAALTGHLVFTTVHANSVMDVVGRFLHMGVDGYSLVSALNGIAAQRLVRVFCAACSGRGCGECRGSGFRGRRAVAEILILDDELRELISERAPVRALKEASRRRGFIPLRERALALAHEGVTSLAEIDRVTLADRAPLRAD